MIGKEGNPEDFLPWYGGCRVWVLYLLFLLRARAFRGVFLFFFAFRRPLLKQIICLSNEPWSSSPGRTQQLVSRLKDTQVLYFSPADSWRDQRFRTKGRTVKPNLTTYTLPPLLLPVDERYRELFQLGQRKLARFITRTMARHRFRAPLLWTTCPEQVHLLDRLDYDGLVYDCDREWDDLPPAWEGALASTADVVFAASQGLADRLSPCSSNIALLPNGATYPLFVKAARPAQARPPRPDPPTFGWAGTIHADLDLSPVLYAAQAHPEWRFLLLGRREPNPLLKRLARLPNVSLLPPCPQMEVPLHLARCQVLLDLLREGQPDSDVVPTRMYEYLSTGRPIVSMLWPDQVEPFPDVVYGAHSNQEFLTLCEHALEELPSLVSQRRLAHGAAAAWSARAGQVSRILKTAGLL